MSRGIPTNVAHPVYGQLDLFVSKIPPHIICLHHPGILGNQVHVSRFQRTLNEYGSPYNSYVISQLCGNNFYYVGT